MSWFAKSLVNTFVGDDEDHHQNTPPHPSVPGQPQSPSTASPSSPLTPTRGVKEDISELTQTLTRQFWGVASFLAPPPSDAPNSPPPESSDAVATGIRSDLAEIGGRFRSGISMLSQTKAVSGISKIAASLMELGTEEEGERLDVAGISDEVVMFVGEIAMHVETWLDFDLLGADDWDDFVMSDAQEEHALAIERLVPRLAALRLGLCPSHMSEGRFWTIYFVLLLPKLSVQDAELLSSPQIVEARALLLQDSQSTTKSGPKNPETEPSIKHQDIPIITEESRKSTSVPIEVATSNITLHEPISVPTAEVETVKQPASAPLTEVETVKQPVSVPVTEVETAKHPISVPLTEVEAVEHPVSIPPAEVETVKHPVQISEIKVVDKAVIEEPSKLAKNVDLDKNKTPLNQQYDDEDADDWLEDETIEDGNIGNAVVSLEQEEDVSFSDLEDDDK